MPSLDISLAELERYVADEDAPADFDQAWQRTLNEARSVAMMPRSTPVDNGLKLLETFDITFPGFGGEPVRGWLNLPAGSAGHLPAVVVYNGYGGGRGLPLEHIAWASAGYAEFFMDTRGQGSSWGTGGETADPHGSNPAGPGFMTRGIESFETYYYRRLVTDAVRAVDAVRTLPMIDPEQVIVAGGSQGGGLALIVAGLADGLAAALPDVPFLCHFRRGVDLSDTDPYGEIARFLAVHRNRVDEAFTTLSYIDGVHHASRATAPALFSVGLWDHVCPPSTVFAAFNSYSGPREIAVYPFNGHEGGGAVQFARQIAWLKDRGIAL